MENKNITIEQLKEAFREIFFQKERTSTMDSDIPFGVSDAGGGMYYINYGTGITCTNAAGVAKFNQTVKEEALKYLDNEEV